MASNALTLDPGAGEDYGDMPIPALSQPGTGAFGGPAPALHAQSPFALPTRPVVVTPPTAPPPVMAPKRPPEMQGLDPASALALSKARAQAPEAAPQNAFMLDPGIYAALKDRQGGTDQGIYAPSSKPQGGGAVPQDAVLRYIEEQAPKHGIDPKVAVAVARSEGLSNYIGDEGSSFGPFQLHMGGISQKYPHPGLGDKFKSVTGLDPRDPKTWQQQVDFALSEASQGGWGPWSGSRESAGRFLGLPTEGIGPYYGIRGSTATASAPQPPKGPFAGTGGQAPSGPLSGQGGDDKLRQLVLLQALWPHFQFKNVQYDPYAVAAVGHND